MKTVIWEVENESLALVLSSVFCLGWLIVFLSSFMISHFEMFGLKQTFDNFKNKQTKTQKFKTNYLYKMIRHPMMLGFLIAFWATPEMSAGHLLFALITTLYIFIAVKYLEEKDLRKSIGADYDDYKKKVPMLIPFSKIR
jgi:protein-S-isoprenylcysteine O-methyltransferase Ste14